MSDPSPALPDGITLDELGARVRNKTVDVESLLGETPVLLFKPKTDEDDSPVYVTPNDGTALPEPSDTSVFSWEDAGPLDTVLRAAVVVPLTVTHRNLYEDRILLGRGTSCDIRLVSKQVSKLHATIHVASEGDPWRIVDQESSNGTRLNGIALEPKRSYRLKLNDELILGDVTALFIDGEGLAQLCSMVR